MPRLPKELKLVVKVWEGNIRFNTNIGLSFLLSQYGFASFFATDSRYGDLELEPPPRKYWDEMVASKHLKLIPHHRGDFVRWPHELRDAGKGYVMTPTKSYFSTRRITLTNWAEAFVDPLTANLVSECLAERVDECVEILKTAPFSYSKGAASPERPWYNGKGNTGPFRALINEPLSGTLMAFPKSS